MSSSDYAQIWRNAHCELCKVVVVDGTTHLENLNFVDRSNVTSTASWLCGHLHAKIVEGGLKNWNAVLKAMSQDGHHKMVYQLSIQTGQSYDFLPNSVYVNAWNSQYEGLINCINATSLSHQPYIEQNSRFHCATPKSISINLFEQVKTGLEEHGKERWHKVINLLRTDQMSALVNGLIGALSEEIKKLETGEYDQKSEKWKIPIDSSWNLPTDTTHIYKAKIVGGHIVLTR